MPLTTGQIRELIELAEPLGEGTVTAICRAIVKLSIMSDAQAAERAAGLRGLLIRTQDQQRERVA